MKKILFSILALCGSIVATAQSTDETSAILQHGDQISIYKGNTGLQQAYANAAEGDVINLSSGSFKPVTIEKAITIYGVGFEDNAETNTPRTQIDGDWTIGKDGNVLDGFRMEGVSTNSYVHFRGQIKNALIRRCYLGYTVTFYYYSENVVFNQCRFNNGIYGRDNLTNRLLISNCYVNGRIYGFVPQSFVNIDHSIVTTLYSGNFQNAQFLWTNSILYAGNNDKVPVGAFSTVKNCIVVNGAGTFDNNMIVENCHYVDLANIFADSENIDYDESRTFVLKEPTTYVGTDGTPIGLSGGAGWNKIPSKPYVSKLSATPSGTNLNVTYEAGVNN